jgi:hypothetical protein
MRKGLWLITGTASAVLAACVLNPQPLPPDSDLGAAPIRAGEDNETPSDRASDAGAGSSGAPNEFTSSSGGSSSGGSGSSSGAPPSDAGPDGNPFVNPPDGGDAGDAGAPADSGALDSSADR